jgi:hypothetical protein
MFKRETINLLLAMLTIYLTLFLCFIIVWTKFDKNSKEPVDERTAARMPVVAVSGGKISLFPYRELADYIQSNSDYTFLIPEDQEERLIYAKHLGAGDAIGAFYLAAAMTGIICLVFFASFKLYQRWLKKPDGQSFTT